MNSSPAQVLGENSENEEEDEEASAEASNPESDNHGEFYDVESEDEESDEGSEFEREEEEQESPLTSSDGQNFQIWRGDRRTWRVHRALRWAGYHRREGMQFGEWRRRRERERLKGFGEGIEEGWEPGNLEDESDESDGKLLSDEEGEEDFLFGPFGGEGNGGV